MCVFVCVGVCVYSRSNLQSEEIVAELVYSFLIPEVQKTSVMDRGETKGAEVSPHPPIILDPSLTDDTLESNPTQLVLSFLPSSLYSNQTLSNCALFFFLPPSIPCCTILFSR